MSSGVKAIPDGYHSVTPHIVVKDGRAALEFYKKAFGAEEMMVIPGPDGKGVMHGEVRIGNSVLMFAGEWPGAQTQAPATLKGTTAAIMIYSPDVDSAFNRAVQAGATVVMPPTNMFWGDRYSQVKDPEGHVWSIATHVEDVPPDECSRRMKEMFAQGGPCS